MPTNPDNWATVLPKAHRLPEFTCPGCGRAGEAQAYPMLLQPSDNYHVVCECGWEAILKREELCQKNG